MRRIRKAATGAALPMVLLVPLLSACGGDEARAPAPTGGVVVPPPPAPAPAPSPAPAPAPSAGDQPSMAGAAIGETIGGPAACSDGALARGADGRVSGIASISGVRIDNALGITYRAEDSFSTDYNGFGGSYYTAADRRNSDDPFYVRYASPQQGELLLGRHGLTFVTFGQENGSYLCFFAAGLRARSLPETLVEYLGVVDGFGVIAGEQKRFAIPGDEPLKARLIMDFATGRGQLTIRLAARDDPFGDYAANPETVIDTVTAEVVIDRASSSASGIRLAGADFSGEANGYFVGRESTLGDGAGLALAFHVSRANGDFVYGSVALSANIM